ncbi:hypothetical protein OSTOST_03625 [Ostertagia ostertagi]
MTRENLMVKKRGTTGTRETQTEYGTVGRGVGDTEAMPTHGPETRLEPHGYVFHALSVPIGLTLSVLFIENTDSNCIGPNASRKSVGAQKIVQATGITEITTTVQGFKKLEQSYTFARTADIWNRTTEHNIMPRIMRKYDEEKKSAAPINGSTSDRRAKRKSESLAPPHSSLRLHVNHFKQTRKGTQALEPGRTNGAEDALRPVPSGVPQGSVLSPILFNIYTRDIPQVVQPLDVTCKMFADDLKLYTSLTSASSALTLQTAIDSLCRWSLAWSLPISASKTKVLHIGGNNEGAKYHLNDNELAPVTEVKDLGFLYNDKLDFTQHCRTIKNKATLHVLNLFRCLTTKNPKVLLNAYKTFVRPIDRV